jgi:predicted ester cyclase
MHFLLRTGGKLMNRQQTIRAAFVIGFVVSLAGLVAACSPPRPKEQPAAPPRPLTVEERVKWYQECWNEFNQKKWDDFKKCYAQNATSQQLGYGKPSVNGADAIVATSKNFAKTFPDARAEAQLILINGNHLAGVSLLKGTDTGPILGPDGKEIRPTNRKLGLLFGHSIDIDPITTTVVNEIGVMDGVALETQLGLIQLPARPLMETGVALPAIVIAKNDEAETKNIEAVKAQMEAWSKHDAVAVDKYEADDYVLHDQTQPSDLNKAQASKMNKDYWRSFSDAKINTSSIWGAGDYVMAAGTFEGTNDADLPAMKLKKTGKKVSFPFLNIFRLVGGKLKEEWLFFDSASFVSQLGVK